MNAVSTAPLRQQTLQTSLGYLSWRPCRLTYGPVQILLYARRVWRDRYSSDKFLVACRCGK